jgi:hypothetical protein
MGISFYGMITMIFHDFQWFSMIFLCFSHVSPWYQHSIPVESTNFHPPKKPTWATTPAPQSVLQLSLEPSYLLPPQCCNRLAAEDVDFGIADRIFLGKKPRRCWFVSSNSEMFDDSVSSGRSSIPVSNQPFPNHGTWGPCHSYVKLLLAR